MTHSLYQGRQEWIRPWPAGQLPTNNEVAARALIVHEGRVLLAYEANNDTWFTPGGRITPGESLMLGLGREIEEETGLEVTTGDLLCFFDVLIAHRESHKFEFLFAATPVVAPDWIERDHVDGDLSGSPVTKLRWFTPQEAAQLTNVFPAFIRNWQDVVQQPARPRAYYATKMEEGAPAEFEVNRFYISARTVTLHEGKVLMVRNHNSDWWYGAGGRIELGEGLFETAVRELDEEAGQTGTAHGVIAVDEFFSHTGKIHQINLYTACTLDSQKPFTQRANDYVAEARLFSPTELAALPRAYPTYMAELAWPQTTDLMKESA